MAITDLGVPSKARVPYLAHQVGPPIPGLTNQYWFIMYCTYNYAGATDLVCLNLDTEEVIKTVGPIGRPFNSGFQYHPTTGLMYLGAGRGSSVPSPLGSYNFVTGAYDHFADMPSYTDGVTKYAEPGYCIISDETPPRVFYGSADGGPGLLCAWTPGGSLENFGILDDPGAPYSNRYPISFQVDATHAYVAIKDSVAGYYLCIVTLATGAETLYWKGAGLTGLTIQRGQAGPPYAVYACTTPAVGGFSYFLLHETDAPSGVSEPSLMLNHTYQPRPVTTGYTINTSQYYTGMYSSDPEDLHVNLGYTKAPNPEAWVLAEVTDLSEYPARRAGLDLDGNLIIYGPDYVSVAKCITATGAISRLGAIAMSGYSVLPDHFRQKVFMGGYSDDTFFVYDPAVAWSSANPLKHTLISRLHPGVAKYIYCLERASNGGIWVGANHVRSTSPFYWAELIHYNPESGVDTNVENAAIEAYYINNMAMNMARSILVFSGYLGTDSTQSKLFVFDAYNKRLLKTITLPAGGPWKVVSVETDFASINKFLFFSTAASWKTFIMDIRTEVMDWGPLTKTGTASLLAGVKPEYKNGYVWLYVGDTILGIDPADGSLTTPLNLSGTSYAGGMVWDQEGNYLYHYDTTTKKLFQVPKADLGV